MERKAFLDALAKGQIPSVLLFEGDEAWLKQSALASLRSALLPPGLEELNETRLENPDTDTLIAAAETLPFMADRRLVLLRDYPPLVGRGESDDRLAAYLPQVPPTTVLLFDCVQKPNAKKKLYTVIKKLGGIVTFAPLRDRELTTFVTEGFREQGKACAERVADLLIFTCGTDTALLRTEIAKIAARRAEPAVSAEDVRELATPSAESTVFQMVDAVVAGQKARAFALMNAQLRRGEDRIFLLAMLLRQFRLMQHIKIMQYEKRSERDIHAALGLPSFAAEQYIRQAGAWSGGKIRRAVRLCLDTEYAVKSGQLNQEGSLEAVMLKLMLL